MTKAADRKAEYAQKLRDPRWQKKRLEIMQRDEFMCQSCFDSESTLNVHHCYYKRGANPWEYENTSLVTLCEECHQIETDTGYATKQKLVEAFCIRGVLTEQMVDISLGLIHGSGRIDAYLASGLAWILQSEGELLKLFQKYCETLSSDKK